MSEAASGSDVDVSVVIVNYNTKHVLSRAVAALEVAGRELRMQVVVVDNASRDGSADFIRTTLPQVTLVANEQNVGFGRANNQVLPLLRGKFVLLLNPDAYPEPDSVRSALDYVARHPRCAALGGRLISADRTQVGSSARNFPTPWNRFLWRTGLHGMFPSSRLVDDPHWDYRRSGECDWVPGAFLLVPRAVIDEVGLFDPRYFLYSEEVDFCRTVKAAGWEVHYCSDAIVVHVGGESAKSDGKLSGSGGKQLSVLQTESELLYYRKHHGLAGFAAALLLGITADTIIVIKKQLGRADATRAFAWTALALRLSVRTRLGTRPTR
jgi:GT2 family glycosyltransferase